MVQRHIAMHNQRVNRGQIHLCQQRQQFPLKKHRAEYEATSVIVVAEIAVGSTSLPLLKKQCQGFGGTASGGSLRLMRGT
jgi:hypothetical protein